MNQTSRVHSVVIVGARGRMGQALVRAVMDSEDLTLVAAVDRSGGPGLGQDVGRLSGLPDCGVLVTDELHPPRGSIVIDFSLAHGAEHNIGRCVAAGVPMVLGTTGLASETTALLARAALEIPIVYAANFSVGVAVMVRLCRIASRTLGSSFQPELLELHHRHKRDAPSGTALRVVQSIAEATGRDVEDVAVYDRAGREGPRAPDEVGIASLRGGDSIGEHTAYFLADGERLEISHRAHDRSIFAQGALRAAKFVATRGPGLYGMDDVLGFGPI